MFSHIIVASDLLFSALGSLATPLAEVLLSATTLSKKKYQVAFS